ncbi:hypothetical protein ACE1TH_02115 [Shouchella sp. JSM 1781072]|uniref:hypothetical protein n=1 Tax=Bacillaceae TaxID=186817 RepID=UPI000C077FA6|nr:MULTISPECIES: hypothetical protein [Bacillaceae]UTR05262.1 hypothetical protein MM326_14250 [Alkalihalobacillus sp. LMS6]
MIVSTLSPKKLTQHHSNALAFPLALTSAATNISFITIAKGEKIGMHQAQTGQRLCCIQGRVEVRSNQESCELLPLQMVEWTAKENHETIALEDAQVIVVETIQFER